MGAGVLAVFLLATLGGCAVAYEEPAYEVVKRFDAFELRRYAPYLVAETTVEGDFEEVGGRAFRLLAAFIGGENRTRQEIVMTAPVNQQPVEGEKIAMTAPVTQERGGGAGTFVFHFVMPAEYTRETVPEPVDPRVKIREVPARPVAALRYSGTWSERRYREKEAALLAAVDAAGLERTGAPIFARYDPPFTLWFLRRNEILVEVLPTGGPVAAGGPAPAAAAPAPAVRE